MLHILSLFLLVFLFLLLLLWMWAHYQYVGKILVTLRETGFNSSKEYAPGFPVELPGFDPIKLANITRQLEEVGFRVSEDLVVEETWSSSPFGSSDAETHKSDSAEIHVWVFDFKRVMVNQKDGCLATLSLARERDRNGRFAEFFVKGWFIVSVTSFSDCETGGWMYTTRGDDSPGNLMWKKLRCVPRVLWTDVADVRPADLFKRHLAQRAKIAAAAGIQWKRNPARANEILIQERAHEEVWAIYQNFTPGTLEWKLFWLKWDKSQEWMGELTGRIN